MEWSIFEIIQECPDNIYLDIDTDKDKKQLNMRITLGTSRHRTLVITQKQTLRVTKFGMKYLENNLDSFPGKVIRIPLDIMKNVILI